MTLTYRRFPKILIKIFSILGVAIVFVSCFLTPVFASGVTENTIVNTYYPYFNLSKIFVDYLDNTYAVFDLPQTFYITTGYFNEDITLTSTASPSSFPSKTLTLRSYVGSTALPSPSVSYSFDITNIRSVKFVFENSVIKSYGTRVPTGTVRNLELPVFVLSGSTVSDYQCSYKTVLPFAPNFTNDYTFSFVEREGTVPLERVIYDSSGSTLPGEYYYLGINESTLDSTITSIEAFDYFDYSVPYFPLISTVISFSHNSQSTIHNFALALPLASRDNVAWNDQGSFNAVNDWYNLYFESYQESVTPGLGESDFTSWLGTAVGGFLEFELIPGVTFSSLLFFILGIGAVNIFLKFFSGG